MSLECSLGLGKTIFNSSVAVIPWESPEDTEIVLTERYNRIKNSGAWPETPLRNLLPKLKERNLHIMENRDVQTCADFEAYYNTRFPFKERLKMFGLEDFSSLKSSIKEIPHHLAHAYSALAFSPFEECLLLVLDGAGTLDNEYPVSRGYEYLSLFHWKKRSLRLLDKKYLTFLPGQIPYQSFAEGVGIFYEKISEYVFNNKTEAGKVMGLAPFGKSYGIQESYRDFLESLDWKKQFKGGGKKDWESSPYMKNYQDLAATVQENFEFFFFNYLKLTKTKFSDQRNLILTGGCALNCTFNGKLVKNKLFEKIYIPSNPGDEGIGLGCAFASYMESNAQYWEPTKWENLTSSRGQKKSVPDDLAIMETFKDFNIVRPNDLAGDVAQLLIQGEIVAFFQGRSEVGPRSLGNRSILAFPGRPNLKSFLNQNVKFREKFRPYGCTVKWEKSHIFFDVDEGFENPFMSFAVPVRSQFREKLKDLSHVDGTSRIQTLHREQNELFYNLLDEMEKMTGLPILLNTSLNVMNEPIVETIQDARRFFESSCLNTIVVEKYLIRKCDI